MKDISQRGERKSTRFPPTVKHAAGVFVQIGASETGIMPWHPRRRFFALRLPKFLAWHFLVKPPKWCWWTLRLKLNATQLPFSWREVRKLLRRCAVCHICLAGSQYAETQRLKLTATKLPAEIQKCGRPTFDPISSQPLGSKKLSNHHRVLTPAKTLCIYDVICMYII